MGQQTVDPANLYFGGLWARPVEVTGGIQFLQLDIGAEHVCGVASDGTGYCWGANPTGELGTGDAHNRRIPTPVVGMDKWAFISAGTYRTCGVTTTGTAKCWGGWRGQEGTVPLPPTEVPGGLTFATP